MQQNWTIPSGQFSDFLPQSDTTGVSHTMLADTPLVKNVDNHQYVKILLDGKTNLEELFAKIALLPPSKENEIQVETDKILPGFRALVKLQNLPD